MRLGPQLANMLGNPGVPRAKWGVLRFPDHQVGGPREQVLGRVEPDPCQQSLLPGAGYTIAPRKGESSDNRWDDVGRATSMRWPREGPRREPCETGTGAGAAGVLAMRGD